MQFLLPNRRNLLARTGERAGSYAPTGRPLSITLGIETVGLGGAEMVLLQLANELRERGHTVNAVIPQNEKGWLLDALQDGGFGWRTYDLRRPIDRGLPGRLARTLSELGTDVIHSHEFVLAVYGAAAGRLLGRPHVITMHGNQWMTKKLSRRIALRWAFRASQSVIAVSEDTRRHLESSLGLRSGIVDVIQNGIPERTGDRHATRRALGVRDDQTLILTVGSLTPRKGHALLLESMLQLRKQGIDVPWRLMIAGEGPERPRLEGMIREHNLADQVTLLGSRNDIPDLNAAADIFVMPSYWEGLPLAILEAMFGGNAVVASNISGIPEAIKHETHGLLVPPGDASALAGALGSVLRDAQYRNRLAAAGLQRARTEFTIASMTSAYERMYRAETPAR